MNTVTIFKDIYIKDAPHYITVDKAIERIKSGRSMAKIEELRNTLDKGKQDALKRELPCVCFSGKFEKRYDENIIEHSGFLILDFDNVDDIGVKMADLAGKPYTYACWLSPRGNGVKCLVRIADGTKHRAHFAALKEIFTDADSSGVNESRVCYESYDPNIYINTKAEPFTRTTVVEKYQAKEVLADESKVFKNLLKWQTNKNGAFVKGERNTYIFKLAGAMCRYGIWEDSAVNMLMLEYPPSNDFTHKEAVNTIKSAYRSNKAKAGTAQFDRDILVDKVTRKEVEVDASVYDESVMPRDVIYGANVKGNAMEIFKHGYSKVSGIGVPKIDERHKSKKGEVTGLTGIGNYGKSAWSKWITVMRVLLYGEKYAAFCPEDNPPEEYYNDYVEILLGCNCTPYNFDGTVNEHQPKIEHYSNAYDFITKYVLYLYPQSNEPTIDYILERFLELIIKEKISGCKIDPWNQVMHDYQKYGSNVSKYLENTLGRISRFAQENNVYMDLIIHPKAMTKEGNGNYACPDKFDLNDGAMWNNKLDNLLVYHRPFAQSDPQNPTCEFHSKKIRRQKTVGKLGYMIAQYAAKTRRFEVDGLDCLQDLKNRIKLDFSKPIENYVPCGLVQPKKENSFKIPDGYQQKPNRWIND